MTAAGALVQFGGGCGAVQTGRHKVDVKIRERQEGRASQAWDDDVFILVFTDRQILRVKGQKVQNLQPQNRLQQSTQDAEHTFHILQSQQHKQ